MGMMTPIGAPATGWNKLEELAKAANDFVAMATERLSRRPGWRLKEAGAGGVVGEFPYLHYVGIRNPIVEAKISVHVDEDGVFLFVQIDQGPRGWQTTAGLFGLDAVGLDQAMTWAEAKARGVWRDMVAGTPLQQPEDMKPENMTAEA